MSIKIRAIARKNPRDLEAAPKYYAQKVNQGDVSLTQLSEIIAQMSTVSKTDVFAVLMGLTEVIPRELSDGKIIRLGTLGSFSVGVSSSAVDTEEEVSSHQVKKLKLNFRPDADLKQKVEGFHVTKIS